MADKHNVHTDRLTGLPTTGHVWDEDLQELNSPLPRWWLWIFYATIVWSVGYWLVYPSWPLMSSYTAGLFGWHSRTAIVQDMEALRAQRAGIVAKLSNAPLAEIGKSPELLTLARAQGRVAFADNCAPCHGAGGGGAKGFPNLNDDDWLWGGTLDDIAQTIRHGVRWNDPKTREGSMPAFLREGLLKRPEIDAVADYTRSKAGLPTAPNADLKLGAKVYEESCATCHGPDGKGNMELGAPNLTDAIWLYGSDRESIIEGLANGRGATMPSWAGRLDDTTIKALTVYVHALGGGK